ncbi:TPA: hypothetical protein EYP26_00325 [Candidatus Bathyarchaeota archaeon]|nr:hypothetical protein [Candidatus Bathyarchaeota archaeon]
MLAELKRVAKKSLVPSSVRALADKLDLHPSTNRFDKLFLYLLAISFILRILWLDKPPGSLIFDEKYYVNVARILLRLPHDPDVYKGAAPGVNPRDVIRLKTPPPFASSITTPCSTAAMQDSIFGFIPSVIKLSS